jgi:hypothetical protein
MHVFLYSPAVCSERGGGGGGGRESTCVSCKCVYLFVCEWDSNSMILLFALLSCKREMLCVFVCDWVSCIYTCTERKRECERVETVSQAERERHRVWHTDSYRQTETGRGRDKERKGHGGRRVRGGERGRERDAQAINLLVWLQTSPNI